MEFQLLGPIEVRRDGAVLALGPPRQRALLAAFTVRANEDVGLGYLTDAVWERPPPSLRANVRTYVAALRRVLRAPGEAKSRLCRAPFGYRLTVRPGELDLAVFEDLAERAARARERGDNGGAAALYGRARALWRGRPLAGLPLGAGLAAVVARLDERRLHVVEREIESRLRLGRHAEVVDELRELVVENPFRESLVGLLMLALYRSGRTVEALEVYRRARDSLMADLGIEPGPVLRRLQRDVLVGGPPGPDVAAGGPARAVPAQLPAAAGVFVGRRGELRRLDQLLDKVGGERVTAVVGGMAGVGKTALVLRWAHQVTDRFPDGQIYQDLHGYGAARPTAPGEALGQMLRGLGVAPDRIPAGVEEQAALYRSALAGKRVLVVLDDARSVEQVRPLLPGSRGCLALVTSRDALVGLAALDGAHLVRLGLLAPGESRQLLTRVLDDDRVRAEPDALAELASACAHLPLALRLAAARLSVQPRHTVAALVARIGRDVFGALRSPADPLAAVRTAFDQSYRALDPTARRLFRRLTLAPGPDFDPHVAAATLDADLAPAEAVLDTLVSAHLVDEYASGRYRLHDLLRQYAADRVVAEDTDEERRAAASRMLGWYLSTVAGATELLDPHRRTTVSLDARSADGRPVRFASHRDALDWCETHRDHLVAAVGQAADLGLHDLARQLPVAMFGFLELRKYWADWTATHETGLRSARQVGDRRTEAWMLNSLGIADKQLGRLDRAVDRYRQALAIRQAIGDRHGVAVTSNNLGTASNRAGRTEEAVTRYQTALAIFREIGDRWGEGLALTNLGEAHRRLGALGPAVACFHEALAIRRALGDRRGEGIALNNLAHTLAALGEHTRAVDHYREALRIRDSAGDRWGVARTLANLGAVLARTGDAAAARRCRLRALAIFDELGDAQAAEIRASLHGDQFLSAGTART